MKTNLLILTALLLLISGCDQFLIEDENNKQFTGKVKDNEGNLLTDVKVFLIYNFDYFSLPKIPDLPATGSYLEQNFPNPFSKFSTFRYSVAETSIVKFDIFRFDGEPAAPSIYSDTLCSGNYEWIPELSQLLPSNGYKIIMTVDEGDSVYSLEQSFIRTYSTVDSSILNSIPNVVSVNGTFELKYNTIPLDISFIETHEINSVPWGYSKVNRRLTMVLYKPGYQILQRDVIIWTDRFINMDFILQPE